MTRTRARKPGRRGGNVPMSLRFPPALRERVRRYAKRKGLEEATAVRVLCAERLDDLDMNEEVRLAEQWQLREALKAWDRLDRGVERTYPASDIPKIISAARREALARKK